MLPPVHRVPIWLVILLCPAVVAGVWFAGTRHYDFLKPPTEVQIAKAKSRATQALAQPSDLFAVLPSSDGPTEHEPSPEPAPEPPPPPPLIPVNDLPDPIPLEYWTDLTDYPAASFVQLASTLEAKGQLVAALVAWERVLDFADASPEETEVAVKGIRRLRASVPPPEEPAKDAPKITLRVAAPADRIELTRKAARLSAESLAQASFRQIRFEALVVPDRSKEPKLTIKLLNQGKAESPSVELDPPADADTIREAILNSAFKLVASSLAIDGSLRPVSQPEQAEPGDEAAATRITRRAWSRFVQTGFSEEDR